MTLLFYSRFIPDINGAPKNFMKIKVHCVFF